jgi:UMF1 family MFS transporter
VPADGAAASWLARLSWALFDLADQPIFSSINTFVFAAYFTAVVVGDPVRGQALWADAQSWAGIVIALSSPVLGAIADAAGPRKGFLFLFQVPCVLGCAALWWAMPHSAPDQLRWIQLTVVAIIVGAEISVVFNNAMLPGLVRRATIGWWSGFAWGLGYVGGLVLLIAMLLLFIAPERPFLGLNKATFEHVRIVGPLVALWVVVFALPIFLFTPDEPRRGLSRRAAVSQGLRNLGATLGRLRHFKNVALFLIARMVAYDGLNAIFAFGGIYATGIFGWSADSLTVFAIIILVFGALGAWAGGWLDDRFGSKPVILLATLGVTLTTLGVLSMTSHSVLFVIPVDGPVTGAHGALFATTAERIFLGFSILLGIFAGPMQAAARTMLARIAPPAMLGEFFGLFALTGKATAFMAPFAIARMTEAFASQRAGLVAIMAFLVVGFFLLLPVRESDSADG